MRRLTSGAVCLAMILGVALPLAADVRLPSIFGDNMVLQRDKAIAVWGTADAGEKVTVALAGKKAEATSDADGKWTVRLDALAAGGPHELTVTGNNTVTLKNVLIGEVWVCSGQSNMNMPIDWGVFGKWGSPESTAALAKIDDPQLRMFLVAGQAANKPAANVPGTWKIAKGHQVLKWSAAAYFFGVELRRELGVPVGLVKSAVGGTIIESWTRRQAMLKISPDYQVGFDSWDRRIAGFDEQAYQKKLAVWQKAAQAAKAQKKRAPRRPRRISESNRNPASLYNGMIAPLIPYGMRGVIWYQGESNARGAAAYRKLFPAMIRDWRSQWKQDDFPFLFVQLANFRKRAEQPGNSQWAELREAQLMALSEPNTAMAVAIDIGEANDIHPKNKQDVGKRLALAAMKLAYGRDIVHSGPIYKSMTATGSTVRLTFDPVGKGLVAKGGTLKGFAVAGADKKFVWAKATIDGNAVLVSSDQVAEPKAVRYGWADNPECTLTNTDGLPASPFRTDTPPDATGPKK
jgi:sialate O-acetylesterase